MVVLQSRFRLHAGGLAIGDLIIHLFRRTGEAVLPVLPQLLEAMLKAMTTAKTASYTQVSAGSILPVQLTQEPS